MSFDYILFTETLVYRSVRSRDQLLGEWYCFTPEDTFGYGEITGEFKCIRPLKLLDITKNTFYNDVTDKITEYCKTSSYVRENKMSFLFPLGFPDFTLYKEFAKEELKIEPADLVHKIIELETQYYGNRSRYSHIVLDLNLAILLKVIYPTYDGIVSPIRLPDRLRNGYQHSEICVFHKDIMELIKELPRPQSGGMRSEGGIKILGALNFENDVIRELRESMKEFQHTLKPLPRIRAEGPIKILGALNFENDVIRKLRESMKEFQDTLKPLPSDPLVKTPINRKRKTRKLSKGASP